MVEYGRKHAARAASGCRHDESARGILLAHGKGVGIDKPRTLQVSLVAFGFRVVDGSLSLQSERPGQDAFVVDAAFHGFLHHTPYLPQIFPDFLSLALLHILPEGVACFLAPCHDFLHGVERIERSAVVGRCVLFLSLRQSAASDAIDRPFVEERAVGLAHSKLHAVGMERQEDGGVPVDGDVSLLFEDAKDGDVGHVPLACGGEGAVERDVEGRGFGVTFEVDDGGCLRPHRMTARRADAYAEEFFQRFHDMNDLTDKDTTFSS